MNVPYCKLLFDECIGRPSIEGLAKLVALGKGEKPEVKHLLQFSEPGTIDEVWIPRLADENWTIVTADAGSKPSRGDKLPNICAKLGVTHVILSPAIQNRTSFEKLLTILSVWYELLDIASNPDKRGCKFVIEPNTHSDRGKGRVLHKEIPPNLLKAREDYQLQKARKLENGPPKPDDHNSAG